MKDADAVSILTEWYEFKDYDWERVYQNINRPVFIFDNRNILDRKVISAYGFKIKAIGKGDL